MRSIDCSDDSLIWNVLSSTSRMNNDVSIDIDQDGKQDIITRQSFAPVWNDRGRWNLPRDRKGNQWTGAGGETKYIDEFDLCHHRSDSSSAHYLHCVNKSSILRGVVCCRLWERWYHERYNYKDIANGKKMEKIAWNFLKNDLTRRWIIAIPSFELSFFRWEDLFAL